MRGRVICIAALVALLATTGASAALIRIQPRAGEVAVPQVRAGHLWIPPQQSSHRIRVIATLRLPPLAAARGGSFAFAGPFRRLDVQAASSKAYLATLAKAQAVAVAQVKAAIPAARIQERYRILLDGFTVNLPVAKLPTLRKLGVVHRLYPSLQYTENLNRSPAIIGATQFTAATGATGAGIKVGVVDDGIDETNPFFNPAGYQYPAGFPKGGLKWTTPKVIVARAYPGPGSGRAGRLPVDAKASFHATHVSGIIAGNANTTAPAGHDHPLTTGLSGVAPRAWLGNYRVFNAPTPIGNVANTPEIVKAFEDAVADGMDVINFSGGGPQTDPINDAMYEAVTNVVNAGAVPVISAGNDREDFGLGTAGSPSTAPDAISVAAVSNSQVFSPALSVTAPNAPASLAHVGFQPAGGVLTPVSWQTANETLIDVGSLTDSQGRPVNPKLCGTDPTDPSGPTTPLRGTPLKGAIALVNRGDCAFVSKAGRAAAAGAIGIVVVDNRAGEANPIPIQLQVPAGMIGQADAATLRAYLATTGGRTTIRISRSFEDIPTGRSGVITSFSSAGPTAYEHAMKPDLAAPGGAILSATLPNAGGPFAVFDGTSMSAPHVSGAAALLLQRHPDWTPHQIKSALMSTAGAAWGDSARTQEASVLLEGAGLINVQAADSPRIFTDPGSLSYGSIHPASRAASRTLLLAVQDAGGGAGTWSVTVQPQSASDGTAVDAPPLVTVPPGGTTTLAVNARAAQGAPTGDDYGFLLLKQGAVTRRIPYGFFVSTPQLALDTAPRPIAKLQVGTTGVGADRVDVYRWPGSPFGPPATYTGQQVDEGGAERLYSMHMEEPVVNFGAAVVASSPGSLVDPWLLGSVDENDVQGYAGTPVNVNSFMFNYQADVGAAGAVFARPKTYYFSVDSPTLPDVNETVGGQYLLRSWVNDVTPPVASLVTRKVAAGRPTLVVRIHDPQPKPRSESGIDPTSIVLAYRNVLLAASAYDSTSGLAVFGMPAQAPPIPAKAIPAIIVASDFQESKNIVTPGGSILPNTTFHRVTIRGTAGAAATWIYPHANACLGPEAKLVVAASAVGKVTGVTFAYDGHPIVTATQANAGLYAATWLTSRSPLGRHTLTATVVSAGGQRATTKRAARVCSRKS